MLELPLAWRAAALAALAGGDPGRALWCSFAAGRSEAQRHQLAAHYAGFARMLAARCYAARIDRGLAFGDYHHFALVGLLECIDRFEPSRGIRFESYAAARVRGAILDGVAALSERQRQAVEHQRRVRERVVQLAGLDGAGPGVVPPGAGAAAPGDAAAAVPGVASADPRRPLERLADLAIGLALGFMLEGSGMFADPDAPAQQPDTTYRGAELRATQRLVRESLDRLPAPQRLVLSLHYLQGVPFCDIAAQLGLTAGRIAQIHHAALLALRQGLQRRRLGAAECW